jgi:hypothetical protein
VYHLIWTSRQSSFIEIKLVAVMTVDPRDRKGCVRAKRVWAYWKKSQLIRECLDKI